MHTSELPAALHAADRRGRPAAWPVPVGVVCVAALLRAYVDFRLRNAIIIEGVSADWIQLFASVASAVSLVTVIAAWLLPVATVHVLSRLAGYDGSFTELLRVSGFGYIAVVISAAVTSLFIPDLQAHIRGALAAGTAIQEMPQAGALQAIRYLNGGADLTTAVWVVVAAHGTHRLSWGEAFLYVFGPLVVVMSVLRIF